MTFLISGEPEESEAKFWLFSKLYSYITDHPERKSDCVYLTEKEYRKFQKYGMKARYEYMIVGGGIVLVTPNYLSVRNKERSVWTKRLKIYEDIF